MMERKQTLPIQVINHVKLWSPGRKLNPSSYEPISFKQVFVALLTGWLEIICC